MLARGFVIFAVLEHGFSRERIGLVKQMHKLLYRDGLTLDTAQGRSGLLKGTVDGGDADIAALLDFLAVSTRGIVAKS